MLHIAKLAINTIQGIKLVMSSALDNFAMIHNENQIGIANCRKAMRNRKHRAVLHQIRKRILNKALGHRI